MEFAIENLIKIFKIIVETNTFNFLILVLLLGIIFKKLDINTKLNNAIDNVKKTIDNSISAKNKSDEDLGLAQKEVKNLTQEIDEIKQKNEESILKNKTILEEETNSQIETIKENAFKIINSKEKEIASRLSKKTVLATIELAKQHVINILNKDGSYHQKFIDESIKELDRLK